MLSYNSWLGKAVEFVVGGFGKITWCGPRALFNGGLYYDLTESDHEQLRKLLAENYYIILIYRKAHFSSYMVGLANLVKTGKWTSYSHSLMNVDNVNDPDAWEKFKLMEATQTGVHWSTFMQVFDCDSVCVLRPKNLTPDDWKAVIDGLLKQEGLPYDDLFELSDATHVSCVELVLNALKAMPDYKEKFAEFDATIQKVGNLTPQMYRDCSDFEVVLEIKR
jgi:hypothetical protein